MDFKDLLFFIGSLIIILSGNIFKNKIRYYLFLLALFFPFQTGIIIYRYNGIWLVDTVLLTLLFFGLQQKKLKLYIPHISLPALLFLFLAFISAFFAEESGYAFSELTKHIRAYLIFVTVYSLVKNKKDIDAILIALMGGLLFQGVLGLYEWRVGSLGLWFLGEPLWSSWRSTGTFSHPSFYSNYIILLLPLAVRLTVFTKIKEKYRKYLYYSALLAGIIGLFASFARGPWLAFAIVIVLMLVASVFGKKWRPRNKIAVVMSVLFAFAFLLRYTPSILIQFQKGTGRDKSTETRMPLIEVGLNVMLHNPLVGVGLANYEHVSYKYIYVAKNSGMDQNNLRQMVHNSLLLMGAETGIPAVLFLVLFFIILFKRSYKVIRNGMAYFSDLAFGLSMGLIAIFVSLLASPDYHIYQVLTGIWLSSGLLLAIEKVNLKYLQLKKQVIGQQKMSEYSELSLKKTRSS